MRFWISWVQPTEDYRPVTYPPNEHIKGWWCSGYDANDNATLCAVVDADNEPWAKLAVNSDWPESSNWRFCEKKSDNWKPGARFVIDEDWMRERLGVTLEQSK